MFSFIQQFITVLSRGLLLFVHWELFNFWFIIDQVLASVTNDFLFHFLSSLLWISLNKMPDDGLSGVISLCHQHSIICEPRKQLVYLSSFHLSFSISFGIWRLVSFFFTNNNLWYELVLSLIHDVLTMGFQEYIIHESSCACLLHPKSRNQGKGMLEVPWLAVESFSKFY